jgi:hypothetical protein
LHVDEKMEIRRWNKKGTLLAAAVSIWHNTDGIPPTSIGMPITQNIARKIIASYNIQVVESNGGNYFAHPPLLLHAELPDNLTGKA